tara:strand:+ start:126 stop:674 length:549 start_codon:yes stop_codon:yes gene_type:complete
MGQRVKFTSPVGTAVYPHLNTPDTQFNPEGVYKTSLSMEDCAELVDMCHNLAVEEFGAKAKFRMPFSQDEETGNTVLKVKSKYAPKIFDSSGQIMVGDQIPNLWGGSTLKVGGFITTYTVSGSKGVSLQLTKVQVINPVSGGGDQDGFDSIDGGFVAQEITQEAFDDGVEQEVVHEAKADRF